MKKIIILLTVLSLLLCCAACGKTDKADPTESTTATEPQAEPNPSGVALIVNGYEISGTEMNYFFMDAINQWYGTYGSYAAYLGLDLRKPLDEQYYDQSTGETWADCFLDIAVESAKSTYSLYGAAQAEKYTLSEEEAESVQELYDSMDDYAKQAGYSNAEDYLKALYGDSSTIADYKEYYQVTAIASSYYSHHAQTLSDSYTDDVLRAFEGDKSYNYNSYSYASFYLSVEDFKLGGTEGEDGKMIYSDEEVKAAEAYLGQVAGELSTGDINTVEKLNAAIKQMEEKLAETKGEVIAEGKHSVATLNEKVLYSKISTLMQEWIRSDARVEGNITAIPYESSTTDANGKEIKVLSGYYIVLFQERCDNPQPLINVRHILAAFKGGTQDNTTGQMIYTDTEKAAAKETAEKLLAQWQEGEATEETFAELANKHSDDGDGTTGGLYEDVYPGQMVTNFNNWCFDESRKTGDFGIVESPYGYHVMYFVSHSEQNYRDYMVSNDLLNEDMTKWQTALSESAVVEEKDLSLVDSGRVIA